MLGSSMSAHQPVRWSHTPDPEVSKQVPKMVYLGVPTPQMCTLGGFGVSGNPRFGVVGFRDLAISGPLPDHFGTPQITPDQVVCWGTRVSRDVPGERPLTPCTGVTSACR